VRKSLAGETFQIMLTVLDGVFDDIVVRAAPVLDDATCAALASATYVFLVLSPEVGAVQTGIGTLQTLKKLAIPDNHVRVVLNQVMPESTLSSGRVEKALGRPLDLSIPYDRAQAAAFAQGTPLVFTQPNAPLAAGIRNLVARL
jgi:Flp pilus assembly CpaE family ATPase